MYRICPHAFMRSRHDSDDKTITQVSNKPANELNVRPMGSRRYCLFITGEVDSTVYQMSSSLCLRDVKLQKSKDEKF